MGGGGEGLEGGWKWLKGRGIKGSIAQQCNVLCSSFILVGTEQNWLSNQLPGCSGYMTAAACHQWAMKPSTKVPQLRAGITEQWTLLPLDFTSKSPKACEAEKSSGWLSKAASNTEKRQSDQHDMTGNMSGHCRYTQHTCCAYSGRAVELLVCF